MALIFDAYYGQGSLKDRVSGTIPANTSTTVGNGSKGRGASFNGSANLNYGNIAGISTNDFALEAWILPARVDADAGQARRIVSKNNSEYSLALYNGIIGGYVRNTYHSLSTTLLAANRPYHIIVNYDRDGNATCYLNGSLDKTTNIAVSAGDASGVHSLFIGAFSDVFGRFHGLIMRVRIYNAPTTATERSNAYQAFQGAQTIQQTIFFGDRTTAGTIGNSLISIDGTNWNCDQASKTAGTIGDFNIASGTFVCSEDSTGKKITCSVNGTLQVRGINLSLWTGNGYVSKLTGDLSGDEGGTVDAASSLSFSGNILTITMTAGQVLRSPITITRGS